MLGHDGAPPGFQVLVVEMRKNMETDFIYKEVFFAPGKNSFQYSVDEYGEHYWGTHRALIVCWLLATSLGMTLSA